MPAGFESVRRPVGQGSQRRSGSPACSPMPAGIFPESQAVSDSRALRRCQDPMWEPPGGQASPRVAGGIPCPTGPAASDRHTVPPDPAPGKPGERAVRAARDRRSRRGPPQQPCGENQLAAGPQARARPDGVSGFLAWRMSQGVMCRQTGTRKRLRPREQAGAPRTGRTIPSRSDREPPG